MRTRIYTNELVTAMRRAEQELDVRMPQALGLIGGHIVDLAKKTTLFTDRTGALRRSILRGSVFQAPDGNWEIDARAGALTGVSYAAAVHDGSRAHEIRPRRRRALRFVGAGGGFVFRRAVQHPGTRPRRFLNEAIDASVPFAERTLGAVVRLAFVRAGFG